MTRLDLFLCLLEEALGRGEACPARVVHPDHQIVELFLEFPKRPEAGNPPALAKPILQNLELMGVLRHHVQAYVEIECLVDGRGKPGEQGAHARDPFVFILLCKERPCGEAPQNDRANNEGHFSRPEPLQPLEERGRCVEAGFLLASALLNQVLRALVHQIVLGIWEPKIFCHSSPAASTRLYWSWSHAFTARRYALSAWLCQSFPRYMVSKVPGTEIKLLAR